MIFKNMQWYIIGSDVARIDESLLKPLKPCTTHQPFSEGWCAVLSGTDQSMLISHGDLTIIKHAKEEKIVPALALNQRLKKEISKKEADGSTLDKKAKAELKESIYLQMLSKAFIKTNYIYTLINHKDKWIAIDTGSASKAESVIDLLRKSLGSFDVLLPSLDNDDPIDILTEWFHDDSDIHHQFGLSVQGMVEFRSNANESGNKSVIACRDIDVKASDIIGHTDAGKRVFKLSICHNDNVTLVIHDDMTIHKLESHESMDDSDDDEYATMICDMTVLNDCLNAVRRAFDTLPHE